MYHNSFHQLPLRAIHLILIGSLALAVAPTVRAASFTVNSTADAVDANPGDGLCVTAVQRRQRETAVRLARPSRLR